MKSSTLPPALRRALRCLALIPALLAVTLCAQTTPNPPGQISYQGYLVDANGLPLASTSPVNYDVVFRLYNASSGGSNLWAELQTVTVDRGSFSVVLGQGSPFDVAWTNDLSTLFQGPDASDRFLETMVRGLPGGDTTIQPRLRLLPSPYAFLAADARNADKLGGYDWSAIFPDTGNPVTGTIPGTKLATNSISGNQLMPGAVGAGQLAPGSVLAGDLAAGVVANSNIMAGAVSGVQIAPGSVSDFQLNPPLSLSANVYNGWVQQNAVLSITNTSSGIWAGDGLLVGGLTAILAYGQNGSYATIAGPNGGDFYGPGSASWVSVGQASRGAEFHAGTSSAYLAQNNNAGEFHGPAGTTAYLGNNYGGQFVGGGATAYLGAGAWAGLFYGGDVWVDKNEFVYHNLSVYGSLSKAAGSFKIDHPLDPANKYLYHSFVESPDMKNIYDGMIALDSRGEAEVKLPAWFEALNQEFRYQLTAVGAPGPNLYVAEEVTGNHFKIAGGAPGMKVSWQVTGVRHDAYAQAHRIPVEEDKPADLKGTYLHPVENGAPAEQSLQAKLHPAPTSTQE